MQVAGKYFGKTGGEPDGNRMVTGEEWNEILKIRCIASPGEVRKI